MNKSVILGVLQMTHSRYITDEKQNEQSNSQDDELYKTLVKFAKNSYVARKKGKHQDVDIGDVKPHQKSKIFHEKSNPYIADLSVSKLPNYHILNVEDISENNVSCFTCSVFQTNKNECFVAFQDPCRLIIYKRYTEVALYSFNFDTIEVQVRYNNSAPNQFLIIVQSMILKFTHESSKILKNWYEHLQKIIDSSFGKKLKMKQIAEKNPLHFQEIIFCTQDQFTTNCQTGDVLLFEDQHFFAKAQRFILNADYDHVAMIIRDKKYGILMFQANSMSGVSLTPWSCMIKYGWYKCIKRIVWRKLENVQRSKFFQDVIHKFVKQNLKANYFISFQKLLSKKSYIGKKQEQKGFFCSELIATIYKDLQILTRDHASKNYLASNKTYPYHFSQKYDLKLEMGNLSKEYEINFNEQLLKKQYGQNFLR